VGLNGLVDTGSGDSYSSRDMMDNRSNMVCHSNRGSMGHSNRGSMGHSNSGSMSYSNRGDMSHSSRGGIGQAVSCKDTMMSSEDTMMSVTQTDTSIIGISVSVSSWGSHGGADNGKKNNKEVHCAES